MAEEIRDPLMSGHCGAPATNGDSHARCDKMGAGQRANPDKVFQPCPCPHHLKKKRFECGNCGGALAKAKGPLREALLLALTEPDEEPDEDVYVHVSTKTGRMVGVYCDV